MDQRQTYCTPPGGSPWSHGWCHYFHRSLSGESNYSTWSCQSRSAVPNTVQLSLPQCMHLHMYMHYGHAGEGPCMHNAWIASQSLCACCVHTLSSCYSSDKVTVIQVQLPLPLCLTEPMTSELWPLHWVVVRRCVERALHTPHSTHICRRASLKCIQTIYPSFHANLL